jgi:hypothetical protein
MLKGLLIEKQVRNVVYLKAYQFETKKIKLFTVDCHSMWIMNNY